MRITSIRITQKHNLGNYESIEFTAEAVIDETDKIPEVTTKLAEYVDWNAQKQSRDHKVRAYRAQVADENCPQDKKDFANKWLAEYESRKARVEAI